MHHHHHPLSKWQLDEGGLRLRLDRRTLVRSVLGAGAAVAALGGASSAQALTREKLSPALIGAIPPRKGVLAWDSLAQVKAPLGKKPQFPAELVRLNGKPVVVEGHMMPMDDSDPVQRFLLTAYRAHCPYCMPGGFASIIAIHAQHPLPVSGKPVTLRGNLRLLVESEGGGLLYQLDKVVAA